jgi:hypothetical protein
MQNSAVSAVLGRQPFHNSQIDNLLTKIRFCIIVQRLDCSHRGSFLKLAQKLPETSGLFQEKVEFSPHQQ